MLITKSHNTKEGIITARCDTHVKEILHLLSHSERLSMSDVVAKSILEYYQKHFPNQSFCKEEQGLFGRYSSSGRSWIGVLGSNGMSRSRLGPYLQIQEYKGFNTTML